MITYSDWENESIRQATKKKVVLPYEDFVNRMIIWTTLSFFIISIQTTFPPIISNISIGNCTNSLSGYPVFDTVKTNNDCIKFIACVANSIGINSSHSLWKSFTAVKIDTSIKNITSYLYEILETAHYINKVEDFNRIKHIRIPNETHMIGWNNFMPPLNAFKPTQSTTINDNWEKELFTATDMQKYSIILSAIYSKIIEFGLNIVGIINETVNKGRIYTVTNKVETTCCLDMNTNTLDYFTNADDRIKIINHNASRLSELLKKQYNIIIYVNKKNKKK